jgi:hypothetical protein
MIRPFTLLCGVLMSSSLGLLGQTVDAIYFGDNCYNTVNAPPGQPTYTNCNTSFHCTNLAKRLLTVGTPNFACPSSTGITVTHSANSQTAIGRLGATGSSAIVTSTGFVVGSSTGWNLTCAGPSAVPTIVGPDSSQCKSASGC